MRVRPSVVSRQSSLVCAFVLAAASANAQTWAPQRNVEIVVGSAPGGSNDRTARQVEKVLLENRLVGVTLSIVNKPGGSNNIAFNYVSGRAGDAHVLMIGTRPCSPTTLPATARCTTATSRRSPRSSTTTPCSR